MALIVPIIPQLLTVFIRVDSELATSTKTSASRQNLSIQLSSCVVTSVPGLRSQGQSHPISSESTSDQPIAPRRLGIPLQAIEKHPHTELPWRKLLLRNDWILRFQGAWKSTNKLAAYWHNRFTDLLIRARRQRVYLQRNLLKACQVIIRLRAGPATAIAVQTYIMV